MNRVGKGSRNELKAKKLLENLGYLVEKRMGGRFSHDFFGLYDLIAISENDMRLVQVKTGAREKPELRRKIKAHKVAGNVTKEVWVFKDRVKEPIIYIL